MEQLTLGGGCFWCLEAIFRRITGVGEVCSGYAGGHLADPDYRMVCAGMSGHAEVVNLTFNLSIVSLARLLDLFFLAHDPTTLNRQGHDVGPQYRSIILFRSDAQRAEAEAAARRAQPHYAQPIVTELAPLTHFYEAEASHQYYFEHHAEQPYCQYVIQPKLEKLGLTMRVE